MRGCTGRGSSSPLGHEGRRRDHGHRAVVRNPVTTCVELDPQALVHERLHRLANVELLEDRARGRVGEVQREEVDRPAVPRREVVVSGKLSVVGSDARPVRAPGLALVDRNVLRRDVADVQGLAALQHVELSRVGRERRHHELVDRWLHRARIRLVRHHGRPAVGRVVGGQAERAINDLPERVRGIGAEIARFGLAGEEVEHRRASLGGGRDIDQALGPDRGLHGRVRRARTTARARLRGGRGYVPRDRHWRDLAQLVISEPVRAVGGIESEGDRVGLIVGDDVGDVAGNWPGPGA